MQPVVIGVDDSPAARHALVWGLDHALAAGLPVSVITAVQIPEIAGKVDLFEQLEWYRSRLDRAKESLDALVAELGPPASLQVETHAVAGHPVDTLVAESKNAAATVVGVRGAGGFNRLLVGSVSNGVAQHAHGPVVVVRPDTPVPVSSPLVVVGFDGSSGARAALAWAASYVRAHDGRLQIVEAWEWPTIQGVPVTYADWDAKREAKESVERAAAESELPDDQVQTTVAKGNAAKVLIDQAAEADLLVVGSSGLGGFAAHVLGSVSQACLHHSDRSVVIVRPPATCQTLPPL